MNLWIENILRYFVLILLQVLLINNLQLLGLCHPCIYIVILLSLPVSIPRWLELFIGFCTGLCIDIFCNSLGVHAASCTLIAYLRPLCIRKLILENERITSTPNGKSFGRINYIKYVIILTVIHHFAVFSLSAFSFHNWWLTLLQIIVSTTVSVGMILGYDLLKH
ncbi:MAG: rod shape-determining protein MreD [Paludibacter sp.]|nr:rod shape-determining protein MreD [Bacteroidales bacterium]MCM1068543.1 rod shape-determining protein MreD [Prevotella sp.]MCM1353207.1 rod shape-determining protein MreD [Bacteroides sp.]MCM1442385.1 rod shape-determining protein MreD [Muribaculum sp.]MCM1481204.1 rod shape-determining protein MreD [Paludibacter sp.]